MRRLIFALAAVLTLMLLCCCADDSPDIDELSYDGSYHMISDGTEIVITEEAESTSSSYSSAFYIPEGMETVYSSAKLDEHEKELYDELVESIANCEESVFMMDSASIYSKLLTLANIEQLSFYHVSDRVTGTYDLDVQRFPIDFTYRFTPEEMSNMNRASEAAANKIMEGITDDMSDYDKLKYFHDYLILNCESDTDDEYANTIYGTLVKGKALCEGYAKSFSYLCNKAGIENMIVTGMTSVAHMWNIVKVDGNWYHVDVTWDQPEGTLAELYPDMVLYQYFMVTDSVIENDHTIWVVGSEPPRCYATKENYFRKENMYVSSEDDIEKAVENAFRSAVKNGKHTAMIKFDTTNLMLSTIHDLTESDENTGYLKDIINKVSNAYDVKLNVSWTDYYSPYRIIVFVIEYE